MGHKALRGALALMSSLVLAHAGCGEDNRDRFIASFDAGPDVEVEAAASDEGGLDHTLGGPCSDNAQCDDQVACTLDSCDLTIGRCRNVPDDAPCQDGIYCNGTEVCVVRRGCAPGPVVTCQDEDGCTIDRCVEATRSCEHEPRDADHDGDPDHHCAGGKDCDDTDPTVASTKVEICGNFKDDNCNGSIDELPCTVPQNDTCATATTLTEARSYTLTTVATKADYGTTCATSTSGQDIVVAIKVPPSVKGKSDVLVRARTNPNANPIVGLALEETCGDSNTEIQCQRVVNLADARAIARSRTAGSTIYALVSTAREATVDFTVTFLDPTTKPGNESCAAPLPVQLEKATAVSLIDASFDLSSDCHAGVTGGELTYSFDLASDRDVRIYATTTYGAGQPIVSLRDPASCDAELTCHIGQDSAVFRRALPKGHYVFSVGGTSQIDASVVVRTSAPTTPPVDQSCATAPVLQHDKTTKIDLTDHEDAIDNGCVTGFADAAYALTLASASDVLLVGRFPFIEEGMVSLSPPACTASLACTKGSTPQRISLHNQPAGDYRVVVGDQLGQSATLTALVRPAIAATPITGADTCSEPFTIPPAGGYFTGDTTGAKADYSAGCDASGQPPGSALDQLGQLVLAARKRVVLDMSGSELQTLLDVRTGEPCPGIEVPTACHPGLGPNRSFLDLTLDAGTYWIQIDGYNGSTGKWALDVRVLDP